MSEKKDSIKDAIKRAKEKPVNFYSYEIEADEIEKGLKLNIYPIRESEWELFSDCWDRLGVSVALIIHCVRDEKDEKVFSEDDASFIDSLGHGFASKVYYPAVEMSGIGEDYSIKKK